MSLHYIIDGYNVIKQVGFLTDQKLRGGRQGLVRFIEQYQPQGSRRNQVSIVFDGQPEICSPAMDTYVRVLFSKNENADEKIKHMVEQARNPKCIVIISDDKQIKFYCRALGAQVKSVKEFLSASRKLKNKQDNTQPEEKIELENIIAKEITEEFKKIWVKE
ncbi:MAG: NYN domain-containing protein [Candidatus Omnitrophota bacterium]